MNIQPLIDKLKLGGLKTQPELLKGGALHTMIKEHQQVVPSLHPIWKKHEE